MSLSEQIHPKLSEDTPILEQSSNSDVLKEQLGDNILSESQEEELVAPQEIKPIKVKIQAPNGSEIDLQLIGSELIQEVKQVVLQSPETIEYSCFELTYLGVTLENYQTVIDVVNHVPRDSESVIQDPIAISELSQDLSSFDYDSVYVLVVKEKRYSERDARIHISRMKDLLEGAQQVSDNKFSIDVGTTLLSTIRENIIGKPKSGKQSSASVNTSKQSKRGQKTKSSKINNSSENTKKIGLASDKDQTAKKVKVKKYFLNSNPPLSTISSLPWRVKIRPEQCLKSFCLSGWNPVRPDMYQKGYLFYLQITTLEGVTYQISSTVNGFYVNNSTSHKFDPSPSTPIREAHSLISLLRKLSPRFTKSFESLQNSVNSLLPLETVSIGSCNQTTSPWVVPLLNEGVSPSEEERLNDLSNLQQFLLKIGSRGSDSIRDWNEELQSIREMDTSSQNEYEGALKDNQMLVWQNEFTEAAISGAIAVVDNDLIPLNPAESPEQHIYLRENIFFSKANDSRDLFSKLGGNDAAMVAASKDVEGVQLLNGLDVKSLYQLGTVLIDYRGSRIVAQTIVPGILRVENENPVVYGSVDNGITIKSDPDFHKLLEPVSNQLRLKEHEIKDGEGVSHTLYTSLDVKGIKGTDSRSYLVDLFRIFPVDSEFMRLECSNLDPAELTPAELVNKEDIEKTDSDLPNYPHKIVLLRNELLTSYWETSVRNQVKEIVEKKASSSQTLKETSNPQLESGDDKVPVESSNDVSKNPELKSNPSDLSNSQKSDLELAREQVLESIVSLNQDAFVPIASTDLNREFNFDAFEKDKVYVSKASQFLRNEVIPGFVNELIIANLAPITGKSLTRHMHSRGINMRYLGIIAKKIPKDTNSTLAVYQLIVREMITRSVKHMIRDLFKKVPDYTLHSAIFTYIINCLFSIDVSNLPEFNPLKSLIDKLSISTNTDVVNNIKKLVSIRFRFDMGDSWVEEYVSSNKRIILRESCLKCGVQMILKNYDSVFSNKTEKSQLIFNDSKISTANVESDIGPKKIAKELSYLIPNDVLNFVPLVRVAGSPVSLPSETLEFGRSMIAEGNKEMGLSLLHNLCLFHEQKCGNLHPTTARCYADLATIYHELDENSTAIELMHQAIVANERSSGVDDTETIYNYLNLAMFEHANKNTELAINYIYHALDLWKLVGSLSHPILSVIYSNLAAMHQQLLVDESASTVSSTANKTNDSLIFFEKSASLRQFLYGEESVLTASSVLNYAKAIASTGDFKLAVKKVKTAYLIFKKILGQEDPKTLDSKDWLDSLTIMAVEKAKNEKEIAEAKAISEEARILKQNGNGTISKESLISSLNSNGGKLHFFKQGSTTNTKKVNSSKKSDKINELSIDDLYKFITGGTKSHKAHSNGTKPSDTQNKKKKN
ncbi:Clustered mitochondria protein-like protein [Smittium mucronatum]|uniref:Clustered mitochondria protein-like protein n=1 Tax=Smittium mucronatum TaxID=133383 RepID=A0A1R0H6S1_9FUNG|nr:Clustered mitochondria protein-like protein [Smittium mucronatum]